MTIRKIDASALECRFSGGLKLGFPTGVSPRRFNAADTVALKKQPGILISSTGNITEWPLERFVEYQGEMAAVGPWVENTEPLVRNSLTAGDLPLLIAAARRLNQSEPSSGGLRLSAVRRLPGGGFLFFPPRLACWLQEISPEENTASDREYWNHPDWKDERAWSFSFGMAAWQILTGEDPFTGEGGEERRERIRRGVVCSITARAGDIDRQAASVIDNSLRPSDSGISSSLEEWEELAGRWREGGITGACGAEEARQRADEALAVYRKKEKQLIFLRWTRRSGWKFALAAAVLAFAVSLAWGPVTKALTPPRTAGMEPLEVAELYYTAIDSLDSELMDDCLARKVGKNDTQMVDTLYVTHKIRQGYEGLGDLPSVSEWLKDGKPELPEGLWPWGITNLELSVLSDGRIQASYEIWLPPDPEIADAPFKGVARQDLLTLAQGRRSWEIVAIQRNVSSIAE